MCLLPRATLHRDSEQKHPDSMMLRGFSGTLGCTGLYFLPKNTTMNGTHYQKVIEDHLLMFMGIPAAPTSYRTACPSMPPNASRTSWLSNPLRLSAGLGIARISIRSRTVGII